MGEYIFSAVCRTGWHIEGSFQPSPFAYSLYHIVCVPLKGDTVFHRLMKLSRISHLRRETSGKDFGWWLFSKLDQFILWYYYYYYYYYRYSALGPVWAETRAQSGDWHGSGTLHPWQILRGSLPLLSPAFRRSHFSAPGVSTSVTTREILATEGGTGGENVVR